MSNFSHWKNIYFIWINYLDKILVTPETMKAVIIALNLLLVAGFGLAEVFFEEKFNGKNSIPY